MSYRHGDEYDPATKGDVRELKEHIETNYIRKIDHENEMNYKLSANSVQQMINATVASRMGLAQAESHRAAMKDKVRELVMSILLPAFVAWVVSTDYEWSSLLDIFG